MRDLELEQLRRDFDAELVACSESVSRDHSTELVEAATAQNAAVASARQLEQELDELSASL